MRKAELKKAKLKQGQLFIGAGRPYTRIVRGYVDITAEEDHPVYGKRYRVLGFEDWFEANCFEWIEGQ